LPPSAFHNRQNKATNAKAIPISRPSVNASPKMTNAEIIGKIKDKRCAASDLTIPAASTALPIITNTEGSNTPSAPNSHQVGKKAFGLLKSGFNTQAVNATATM
jgi:hypothetical protein